MNYIVIVFILIVTSVVLGYLKKNAKTEREKMLWHYAKQGVDLALKLHGISRAFENHTLREQTALNFMKDKLEQEECILTDNELLFYIRKTIKQQE